MTAAEQWTTDEIRAEAERLAEAERAEYCRDEPGAGPGEPEPEPGPGAGQFDSRFVLSCIGKNQVGDAELFRRLHMGRFLYDHAGAAWYQWAGHYWQQDKRETAVAAVQNVCLVYETELQRASWRANQARAKGAEPDKDAEGQEKALRARLSSLQTRARIADILALARAGNAGLSTAGDVWDTDPMLLAVQNGVINLTDGSFRDGKPEELIKSVCPVEWRGSNEAAPAWERFMTEIFNNNPELVAFMQRLLGYCITGQTNEEVYPILYGIGRNGKSKLVEAVKGILGDYPGTMSIETVMKQKADNAAGGARADLMALRGKRFVTASESDDGHRLNVGRIKALSGGDRISARGPFERYQIDFEPTHKMILLTNYKPKIPPDDYAAWQRILLIPFSVKFVQEPKAPDERLRDENIKEKLQAEFPGILAWCVRGCLEWQRIGLKPPEIVRAATESYRAENDSLADFIADCCKPVGEVQVKVLFDAYQEYCQESGIDALRINEFSEHMHRKYDGYSKYRKKFLIGISLLSGGLHG